MIKVLALKELLDQLSSPKFVFLFAVSTVLVVFSLYTGSSAYVGARSEFQATQRLSRTELENRRGYDEVAQFGVKVARAPAPLSALAGGVSSALGRSARVRPENSEVLALICDNSQAKALTGWTPQVDLDSGLRAVMQFIRQHPDLYRPAEYQR